MKLISLSLALFIYGAYISFFESIFNKQVQQRINKRLPLTDRNIIKISTLCYRQRKNFKKMEQKLIAKITDI